MEVQGREGGSLNCIRVKQLISEMMKQPESGDAPAETNLKRRVHLLAFCSLANFLLHNEILTTALIRSAGCAPCQRHQSKNPLRRTNVFPSARCASGPGAKPHLWATFREQRQGRQDDRMISMCRKTVFAPKCLRVREILPCKTRKKNRVCLWPPRVRTCILS